MNEAITYLKSSFSEGSLTQRILIEYFTQLVKSCNSSTNLKGKRNYSYINNTFVKRITNIDNRIYCIPQMSERALVKKLRKSTRGYLIIRIDSRDCKNKEELFGEFTYQFDFPEYFGYNWDALKDCMTDLSWFDDRYKGIILIVNGQKDLLSQEKAEDKEYFYTTLLDIATYWKTLSRCVEEYMAFNVILCTESSEEENMLKHKYGEDFCWV